MSDPVPIPVYLYGEVCTYALVDAEDAEWAKAHRWWLNTSGYARNVAKDLMHRSLLGLSLGDERVCHHKNGVRLDNRRANLAPLGSRGEHSVLHRRDMSFERQFSRLARAVAVAARGEYSKTHGRNQMYRRGCRCADCTRAHADATRSWRRRSVAA